MIHLKNDAGEFRVYQKKKKLISPASFRQAEHATATIKWLYLSYVL